jgi:glycosyltransferase involved in cell wall biosynthesis
VIGDSSNVKRDVRVRAERTVLLVTYAFAPVAYVGVYRSLKYCKYLLAHAWRPIVLTARPHPMAHTDDDLCRQIPVDVAVHRTVDIDPAKYWQKRRRVRCDVSPPVTAPPNTTSARPGLVARFKQAVFRAVMESPDSHWLWLPFALARGCIILLRKRVDIVYCSSPPHSSHVIAFLLARLARKPCVLDFRDPWTVQGGGLRRLEASLRRMIVRGAAKVICVSPGELAEIRAEFPDLDPSRFVCITNGYDADDAPTAAMEPSRHAALTLIHAGTIYPGTAGEFFGALLALVRTEPDVAARIKVDLIGGVADEYAGITRELEDAGIVRHRGFVPHQTALQMMRESDVSVVLLGGEVFPPSEIPAKTFEYLHAARPILAIAAEGDLAETLRQSGLGIVVPPQSIDLVVQALRQLVTDYSAGELRRAPNLEFVRRFDRRALTGKLAQTLDDAIAPRRAPLTASEKWTSPAPR